MSMKYKKRLLRRSTRRALKAADHVIWSAIAKAGKDGDGLYWHRHSSNGNIKED